MKKLLTLTVFFVKSDRDIEIVKNIICIATLVAVLFFTLSSCSPGSDSDCPTVVEKRVDKNYSPSKLYIVLSNGQISGVSYTKYSSLNIGDRVCNILEN